MWSGFLETDRAGQAGCASVGHKGFKAKSRRVSSSDAIGHLWDLLVNQQVRSTSRGGDHNQLAATGARVKKRSS